MHSQDPALGLNLSIKLELEAGAGAEDWLKTGLGGLTAEITGGGILAKMEDVEMGMAGPSLLMLGLKVVPEVTVGVLAASG